MRRLLGAAWMLIYTIGESWAGTTGTWTPVAAAGNDGMGSTTQGNLRLASFRSYRFQCGPADADSEVAVFVLRRKI